MQTVYGVNELAERWNLSPATIRSMEQEGKLHRLPDLPGVKYSAVEVYQLENIGREAQPLTPYERRRLEDKIRDLEDLVGQYQLKLMEVMKIAGGVKAEG